MPEKRKKGKHLTWEERHEIQRGLREHRTFAEIAMIIGCSPDTVSKEIRRLEDFPFIGSVPRYAVLRHRGYRYLISDRWLVFYKVNEKERLVIVYAVLDARQDYLNLLI